MNLQFPSKNPQYAYTQKSAQFGNTICFVQPYFSAQIRTKIVYTSEKYFTCFSLVLIIEAKAMDILFVQMAELLCSHP
jgi:hypothetical protein